MNFPSGEKANLPWAKLGAQSKMFTCEMCGKKSRHTGYGSMPYCKKCINEMEHENAIADGKIKD